MEKILEKSGKSQGILSVRKSGNPVDLCRFDLTLHSIILLISTKRRDTMLISILFFYSIHLSQKHLSL